MPEVRFDSRIEPGRFPVGLLALGYGLGLFAGSAAYLLGSGFLAAVLIAWLGGAALTLICAAVGVYLGPRWAKSLLAAGRRRILLFPAK